MRGILQSDCPAVEIQLIRYFTSPVIARLARRGAASVEAQNKYIKALRASDVQVHLGRHQLDVGMAPRFLPDVRPDRSVTAQIWRLTEKETDVRLALSLYRDTVRMCPEQVVLVSGDSDMAPVLEAMREDFPSIRLGLVVPRRQANTRAPQVQLPRLADWTRPFISDNELSASQFPDRVPTLRKPAIKPVFW